MVWEALSVRQAFCFVGSAQTPGGHDSERSREELQEVEGRDGAGGHH